MNHERGVAKKKTITADNPASLIGYFHLIFTLDFSRISLARGPGMYQVLIRILASFVTLYLFA